MFNKFNKAYETWYKIRMEDLKKLEKDCYKALEYCINEVSDTEIQVSQVCLVPEPAIEFPVRPFEKGDHYRDWKRKARKSLARDLPSRKPILQHMKYCKTLQEAQDYVTSLVRPTKTRTYIDAETMDIKEKSSYLPAS